MPIDQEPTWRDMAFLAAVPASEVANRGGGSLISLERSGDIGPEIRDYARRYRPETVVTVSDSGQTGDLSAQLALPQAKVEAIHAASAQEAAEKLSQRFWKSSKAAVVVRSDDYEAALKGASVAALVKAPLLFTSASGLSATTQREVKRLGVVQLITVGAAPTKFTGTITRLAGPNDVMAWARRKRLGVSYLAAVNPQDRNKFVVRKLSLAGAQLAAGRRGLVAPLNFDVQWKRAFESKPLKGDLPKSVPASEAPAKEGTITLGAEKHRFILTGQNEEHHLKLSLDLSGKGTFAKPLMTGDKVTLGGMEWVVSLGKRTKFGNTDVHLTWPTADLLKGKLDTYYQALGAPPRHLCLVGFPDTLPHAIVGRGGIVEEQASDLPYALVGEGSFASIGVGRLISESHSFASLYAARALTYQQLRDAEWQNAAGLAEWENTFGPLFENVGFRSPHHLTSEEIPWKIEPTEEQPGVKSPSFAQDSPLARCAVLAHSEHSWWRGLGSMFNWDAEVLLSPTVVESGGCGTACLDREQDNRSVVARLLRLGAVSFSGGSREHSAEGQPLRMQFWNAVLAGETLGQAHRRAWNAGLLTMKDRKEGPGGAYRYNTQIRMLFGDPALTISVPTAPQSQPARTVLKGNTLSVFAPEKWTVVKAFVPPDWKQWAGKDLYAVRGPGAYAMSSWSGRGRDEETLIVGAEFTTHQKVKLIRQVGNPPKPLGWNGNWYSSSNPDGSTTYRFAVQMIDFDPEQGKILATVNRVDYEIEWE